MVFNGELSDDFSYTTSKEAICSKDVIFLTFNLSRKDH